MKKFIFFGLFLILIIGSFSFWAYKFTISEISKTKSSDVMSLAVKEQNRVETYLRENINSLSPDSPVLGGKFFVTNVTFLSSSKALVNYEDGHNTFVGRVNFFIEPRGEIVNVLEFIVIERK